MVANTQKVRTGARHEWDRYHTPARRLAAPLPDNRCTAITNELFKADQLEIF